jgi:hypothetical protein
MRGRPGQQVLPGAGGEGERSLSGLRLLAQYLGYAGEVGVGETGRRGDRQEGLSGRGRRQRQSHLAGVS